MQRQNLVNIGPHNGLLPDGGKLSDEPMLIYPQWILGISPKDKFKGNGLNNNG